MSFFCHLDAAIATQWHTSLLQDQGVTHVLGHSYKKVRARDVKTTTQAYVKCTCANVRRRSLIGHVTRGIEQLKRVWLLLKRKGGISKVSKIKMLPNCMFLSYFFLC